MSVQIEPEYASGSEGFQKFKFEFNELVRMALDDCYASYAHLVVASPSHNGAGS